MKEILKLDHIQKYYGNGGNVTKAIQDISFSVQEGEFVGIMGASGSGKTTLLNCISTIDTVSAGHIYLDGTDVTEINEKQIARFRRENLGFVFQDFNLLDTLTISENIALALTINKVPAGEIDGRVREMAGKLNITDILDKYPYQVSGGQKQRCACARAIINQPKLILADEPTGALDSHSSQALLSTIQSINESLDATILMVTHDAFSASYANRILFLRDGAIFTEILKGSDSRRVFFEKILDVLTMMGEGISKGDTVEFTFGDGTQKIYTVGGILDGDLYSNTAIYGGWFLMPTELIAENSVSFNVSIRLIVKANDTGLEHTTISLEKLVDMSDGLTLTTMQEAIASKEATIRQVGISIIGVTLFLLLFSIITFASTIITNIATKKREYAMFQSIGMTRKQTEKMALCESCVLAIGSLILTLILGIILGQILIKGLISAGIFYLSYTFPLALFTVYCIVVVLIILMITISAFYSLQKTPLVERLRIVD